MFPLRGAFGAVAAIALLLSLPFFAAPVAAQEAAPGQVTGRVFLLLDGDTPEGLEVGIEEAGRSTLVNRAGWFELNRIPAGQHTLKVSYRGVELHQESVEIRSGERVEVNVRPTGAEAPAGTDTRVAQQPPRTELERLVDLLVRRGTITRAEGDQLVADARRDREAARVPLAGEDLGYEPTLPVRHDQAAVQVLPFAIESWDGSSRFRVRGRMQLDAEYASWGDDISNVARQGNDFPEFGMFLRRVRLGAAGIMHQNWEWQVEVDYSENEVDLANVYLAYLSRNGRLAAGYFKEPFGMEYATSSRYITFIERSAASDAYKVNREMGLMYETLYRNWYGGVGVFGGGVARDRDLQKGWAVSGRFSVAPYLDGGNFVHLGAGVNRRVNGYDLSDEEWTEVRLRTREGVRAIDARLIGRDDLVAVEDFTRSGVEFAAGFGPWWIQSEYLQVAINLDREALEDELGGNATDLDKLKQHGFYVQTGFFLTGESRNYRAFSGDFGRHFPHRNFSRQDGGLGSWEVALRYSRANSLEHTRVGRGQAMDHYTLGLNWYISPEIAIKLNAIYLEGERDEFKDDAVIFGARLQYIF
jgi:phosphate-selective porin OprO and OprP